MPIRLSRRQIRAAIAAIKKRKEPVTLSRVCEELRMSRGTVNKALDALGLPRFRAGRPAGTATARSWQVRRKATSNG